MCNRCETNKSRWEALPLAEQQKVHARSAWYSTGFGLGTILICLGMEFETEPALQTWAGFLILAGGTLAVICDTVQWKYIARYGDPLDF